ncbi:MAG: TauD/TfdA family dioxygenase [Legionellaceae bacterium]|nr:TauD/TfdA family dioxygenase [Legionellaceae bacterium]
MKNYKDVVVRFLKNSERRIASNEKTLPLVIEAKTINTFDFLKQFVVLNSEKIIHDVSAYGAILFRGFAIKSTKEFEEIILSIDRMKGISDIFMSEPGRTRVDNLKFVFHTNSLAKTGGGFRLPSWHSENFFLPDVPHYIAFCCFLPPKLGGETGLLNMNKIFEELDVETQHLLERKAFCYSTWSVTSIAHRYKMLANKVIDVCSDFGLDVRGDFVYLHKPAVLEHPLTKRKSLQINFGAIPNLHPFYVKKFCKNYMGFPWLLHRMLWSSQKIYTFFNYFSIFAYHPSLFFLILKKRKEHIKVQYTQNENSLNQVFREKKNLALLANLISKHQASFTWKEGDILLVDNTYIAHTGMPGFGARKIRALMCNPLKIDYSATASGIQIIGTSEAATLGSLVG